MTTGVYKISNIMSGDCYIGSSVNIEGRMREHFNLLRKGRHHSNHLQNAFSKYGEENFGWEVVEKCSVGARLKKEQKWIDTLHPVYNHAKVAGTTLGIRFKRSKEYIAAMAERMLGNKNAVGAERSEETRLKLSNAAKRWYAKGNSHTLTPEGRERIVASLKGNQRGKKVR